VSDYSVRRIHAGAVQMPNLTSSVLMEQGVDEIWNIGLAPALSAMSFIQPPSCNRPIAIPFGTRNQKNNER
jgi:hypothetical protein